VNFANPTKNFLGNKYLVTSTWSQVGYNYKYQYLRCKYKYKYLQELSYRTQIAHQLRTQYVERLRAFIGLNITP